jgi:hypothetical protein
MVTGRRIVGGDPKPSFKASLQLDAKDLHQTLQLSAAMVVNYPEFLDKGFTNVSQQVTKTYTVFVVTPEELAFNRDNDLWKHKEGTSGGMIIFGVLGALLISGVGVVFTRPRRATHRRKWNGHRRSDVRAAAKPQRFRR